MKPIIEFKNDIELKECLKYWQNILYLNDWIFSVGVVDDSEIPGNQGECKPDFVHGAAAINIARHTDDLRGRIVKVSQEVTLVHELLHCKYAWISNREPSYEEVITETQEHALLEQMARSLIMVKYGLTPDWFNNT